MTKTVLLAKLHDELKGLNLTHHQVKTLVDHLFYTIYKGVKNEGKVSVGEFIFKKVVRNARKCRNPRTGEMIDVPASESIVCRVKLD